MIPDETIDQIREATDIVQIVGEFLRLKKRGRNHLALCPFHTEKTPSFSVSQDKQIFHCFGCGKGGNVFTFLMEHEKMTFVEAVRYLARKANIMIPEERVDSGRRQRLEQLNWANQVAMEYFEETLFSKQYQTILEGYLRGRREITDETTRQFHLGLVGESWDGLIQYASKRDLGTDILMEAGLALKARDSEKIFDRFRQRLMIPIFGLSDKPIAFGGRTLKKGEPAKYINSPETPLYNKSNVLYGLNFAKDAIRKAAYAYVVEGYFDVISLWQVGIKNVVASSGTAFTEQQARLLARFADEVFLFFDADSAGQNAALKSVDVLYDNGLEVRVISAPGGEDPDSIARQFGPDRIDELRDDALGFIPFRVKHVDLDSAGIVSREKLVKELRTLGNKIGDPTRRDLFFDEAAQTLGVNTSLFRQGEKTSRASTSTRRAAGPFMPDEIDYLSLLFAANESVVSILETIAPDDLDSRRLARLYAAMIQQHKDSGEIDAGKLIQSVEDPDFISLISEVAAREWEPDDVAVKLRKAAKSILEAKRKRLRQKLREEMARAEAAGDTEKADRLLKEIEAYLDDA